SGTVVSPHVIATVAHGVDPAEIEPVLGAGYKFGVFLGTDNNDPKEYNDTSLFVQVEETTLDPLYKPAAQPPLSHDVGAVVTKTALTMAPMPMNRTPLGMDWVGAPARAIGYGRSVATDDNSSAVKKQGAVTIAGIDDEQLWFTGKPGTCEGDSGGPT